MELDNALLGFAGVVVGAAVSAVQTIFLDWHKERRGRSVDRVRKELLKKMLDNSSFDEGRSLSTLSKVVGATREECRRLLIEIGARGFTLKDGREGWTYIHRRPLAVGDDLPGQ